MCQKKRFGCCSRQSPGAQQGIVSLPLHARTRQWGSSHSAGAPCHAPAQPNPEHEPCASAELQVLSKCDSCLCISPETVTVNLKSDWVVLLLLCFPMLHLQQAGTQQSTTAAICSMEHVSVITTYNATVSGGCC